MRHRKFLHHKEEQNALKTNQQKQLFFSAVLIEKLLRSCDVENIYILIRNKKDDDIHTRLGKIFDDPVSKFFINN